ncbi:MAG: MarR family transcriptional regulator, partial [Mesorhizobium sp.]
MNIKQELPWDNPRFRNWVAVARACHVLERTLAVKL